MVSGKKMLGTVILDTVDYNSSACHNVTMKIVLILQHIILLFVILRI